MKSLTLTLLLASLCVMAGHVSAAGSVTGQHQPSPGRQPSRSSAADAAAAQSCPPARWLPPGPANTIACRLDARLTRLFTPMSAPPSTYAAYVTTAALDTLASLFRMGTGEPDAWAVRQLEPLDAFGTAGAYNPSKVARLYVGKRARVARGPIVEHGVVVASVWLISPYPDPSLSRLEEEGTMIVEYRIGR